MKETYETPTYLCLDGKCAKCLYYKPVIQEMKHYILIRARGCCEITQRYKQRTEKCKKYRRANMKITATANGITAEITLTKEQEKVFEKPRRTIWIMSAFGVIYSQLESKDPKDDLGCFRYMFAAYSEAECIERKKAADMIEEYREHAEKCNGDKLDWENEQQAKFAAIYDSVNKVIHINSNHTIKYQGVIYFKRCEDIETFITKVGEADFIKYVLGVRE